MSVSDRVYWELDKAGLAPPGPIGVAPEAWRSAIEYGVGDADDYEYSLSELENEIESLKVDRSELREQVRCLESDLKNMTKERDRLAKAAQKETVPV